MRLSSWTWRLQTAFHFSYARLRVCRQNMMIWSNEGYRYGQDKDLITMLDSLKLSELEVCHTSCPVSQGVGHDPLKACQVGRKERRPPICDAPMQPGFGFLARQALGDAAVLL